MPYRHRLLSGGAFAIVCTVAVLCMLLNSNMAQASCANKQNSTLTGYCVQYPIDGVCGSAYAGKMVWLANDTNFRSAEQLVIETVDLAKRNSDLIDSTCFAATEKHVCNRYFPACIEVDGMEIPRLTCQADCENYWQACQSGLDVYLTTAIEILHVSTVEGANVQHCGTGTWTTLPQPSDRFGDRLIPFSPTWLEGYRGELLYPPVAGTYKMPNGTQISVPCSPMLELTSQISLEQTCAFPLVKFTENGADFCAVPCPFPVIGATELQRIGWAFVIPALFGMVFSVFVCMDTLWTICDINDGGCCYKRVRKFYGKKSMASSRHEGSSVADVVSGGNGEAPSSGSGGRGRKVRASMTYALVGSILGIIYFIIGPLMTLLRFENISCGTKPYFDVSDLLDGTQMMGDSKCQAQRVAPFVLQGIFNLMLYALFQVLMMVDQSFKQWSKVKQDRLSFFVLAYCSLGPFVTMGIALGLDKTTNDLTQLFGQLARNAAICTMRLTPVQEMFLVFIPFILTGVAVSILSLYIWIKLSTIQAGVKHLMSNNNKASDQSLRLLMVRLTFLGLATFIVIIILMSVTGYLIQTMETYSPRFNYWFACETTTSGCSSGGGDCPALREVALASAPDPTAFAVQIAAMSCISLLLSGFFAAQSAPRLFREWMDGSLTQKLDNILEGRPFHYNVGHLNGSSAADQRGDTGDTAPVKGRVAPMSSGNGSNMNFKEDTSVAAYMGGSIETQSPVFEHEMRQSVPGSSGSRRVEDSS